MLKTRYYLYAGGIIPLIFWITIFVCGTILGDYNHFSGLVSELGALGTETQTIFTIGLVLCSLLSIVFAVGLFKICSTVRLSILPVILIFTYSLSIGGAGLFPMPLRLHGILGVPSILLIFSPLLSLILWRKTDLLPHIKYFSIISFVIMLLGFLIFLPNVLNDYPGLKQRFFHIGWSVWFLYLSYIFLQIHKKQPGLEKS